MPTILVVLPVMLDTSSCLKFIVTPYKVKETIILHLIYVFGELFTEKVANMPQLSPYNYENPRPKLAGPASPVRSNPSSSAIARHWATTWSRAPDLAGG